jgi:hypothetical protein
MNVHDLKRDIQIFGITVATFPEGIEAAFQKLSDILPSADGREFYGISHPNHSGAIIYKAMVNALYANEGEQYGCESFVIKQGSYLSEKITHFRSNPLLIGKAFQAILKDPRIDHKGYCLEIYRGDNDVLCMVPLDLRNKSE